MAVFGWPSHLSTLMNFYCNIIIIITYAQAHLGLKLFPDIRVKLHQFLPTPILSPTSYILSAFYLLIMRQLAILIDTMGYCLSWN